MQALIDFLSQHPALALGVVFAASLLESVAVIGTIIPGSSVVVAAGVLIGLQVLDPWWVAATAVIGAILGDGFSFWLGHRYHERLRAWWPLSTHPELLARGQAYFAEHGGTSVFLGRFLGPVRAIVPVVAGMSNMPRLRFAVVNVLSAIAWSAAHLLPGALFGASLQLVGAVSSRLLILLAGVVAVVWLCTVLLRLTLRGAWPVASRQRDRMVAWARPRTGVFPRFVLSLLEPARPESLGLLIAAVMLLGGAWMFLGITEDVVSSDPLVQFDHVVFTALQKLRTGLVDEVMIAATELGSAMVAIAVIASVSVVLAWKRCWRTLAYWLTAVGFAQALVWILKMTLERARPMAMYDGTDQFSFPSGHAASSIVLYGFLAFLLAHKRSPKIRFTIALLAAGLVGLIAFSRLYLGAHWLSDVIASLSLGTAWVALLGITYMQHEPTERLPARTLLFTALGTLILAGSTVVVTHHAADAARYAPRQSTSTYLLVDWRVDGWQRLPAHRTEVDGDHEEPLSVQWAGTADRIVQELEAGGWRRPPPWTLRTTLLWLLPSTRVGQLPVLVKLHQGASPTMSFERELDPSRRLVIRLWPTSYQVGAVNDPPVALWIGMATLERLAHPAGMATLAMTDQDFGMPTAQLAKSLHTQGVRLNIKRRDTTAVLLVR
ncbi:bifunctional DedA family/phosphatase PAP2 family protein [Rhodoferax sp. UBA5149]|uniref:bifunctional DedA family/phosphatase PAP2 family protein n=1 Tax=Rhodoferax sp. UBA5149 TaxID=1947379 RepID=UPI0025DD552A|nr:bifunctional DedA family/phosphatase PAP2 family protein [Rhodoferax sp. UBA5149]